MTSIDQLKQENQDILDLQLVLSSLIEQPELRCNPVFGELLHRYQATINNHLSHLDPLYAVLMNHPEKGHNEVANQFLNGTHELRRVLRQMLSHLVRCCGTDTSQCSVEDFITDAKGVFKLVTQRIKMERERLLPALVAAA